MIPMIRWFILTFTFTLTCFGMFPLKAEQSQIVSIINQDVITNKDIEKRVQLIMRTSQIPDQPGIAEKLRHDVLRMLIDETLKTQEALKYGLSATKEEIETAFANMAKQNNKTPEELSQILSQMGVEKETLLQQIASEIAWAKLVHAKLKRNISVSPREVEMVLDKYHSQKDKGFAVRLAEINLNIDNQAQEKEAYALGQRIIQQIKNGARFSSIARQFSQSASAANGGDLGWLHQGQLQPEIASTIANLSPGQMVDKPIRTSQGLSIILVIEKQAQLDKTQVPTKDIVTEQLSKQKMDIYAQRYLRDIRQNAHIDIRGGAAPAATPPGTGNKEPGTRR